MRKYLCQVVEDVREKCEEKSECSSNIPESRCKDHNFWVMEKNMSDSDIGTSWLEKLLRSFCEACELV